MANRNEKTEGTVAGRFYVDATCIDCDMCRGIAPATFRRNDEIGLSIAYRQPTSTEEENLATEAMTACPSESIGNDGY
jgi:ferredoxin